MVVVKNKKGGFTIIELLVTISIFVILTGIVIFSYANFNSNILLTNLAYDTALTVRQAQNYGINIKGFNDSAKFVPYGVHFNMINPKSFILFADIDYDINNPDSQTLFTGNPAVCKVDEGCISKYNIKRGNYISKICIQNGSNCDEVNKLDILFKRPNPEAIIFGDNMKKNNTAIITLSSIDGKIKEVEIHPNGLIQVKN